MATKGYTRFVLIGPHAGKTISLCGDRFHFVDGAMEVVTSVYEANWAAFERLMADSGAYPEGAPELKESGHGGGQIPADRSESLGGAAVDDGGAGEGSELPPDEAPVDLQGDDLAPPRVEGTDPDAEDRPRPRAQRRRASRSRVESVASQRSGQ